MMTWLRLYWSVLNYHKMQNVATETDEEDLFVLGAWAGLLCIAGRGDPGPDGGRLLITKGRPATVKHLAKELRIDPDRLANLLEAFADYGSVTFENGTWSIKNWGEYQKRSDYSTTRVRKYRAKKKAEAEEKGQAQPLDLELPPANDEVQNLMNHFTEETGIFPPAPGATEQWRDKWMGPTIELLNLAGHDLTTARAQMSGTIALMREKGLRFSCPRSLVNTTRRWLGERAWILVSEEMRRVGANGEPDLPEELLGAIRRAGGWHDVCMGRPDQTEQRFVQAYVQGLRK